MCKNIVIIGGNECMERRYCDECKNFGCKAKVFCKLRSKVGMRPGNPDLLILFTNTVSHNLVHNVLSNVDKNTVVIRSHTSSISSLHNILKEHVRA